MRREVRIMSRTQAESPITCRMDALSPEQRHRRSEILDRIGSKVTAVSETEDGLCFSWSAEGQLPALVGEFVALESLCCPFIRFTLDVEAERGPVSLRLGGRAGVKEFLQATFSR
jgi:hypothetical protein